MSELTFAKSFLSTLDSRSIKLQADYVADPKTMVPKTPYTLPRHPHLMSKPSQIATTQAPGSTPSVTFTVTLKSLRNPPLSLILKSLQPTTSMHDLKLAVASELSLVGTDNIRVLWKKKPVSDARSVREVVGDEVGEGGGEVEFGIMVIGGVPVTRGEEDVTMGEAGGVGVAQGISGAEVLGTEEFWEDLRGWLMQRIRDEGAAGEAWEVFKGGWKGRGKAGIE